MDVLKAYNAQKGLEYTPLNPLYEGLLKKNNGHIANQYVQPSKTEIKQSGSDVCTKSTDSGNSAYYNILKARSIQEYFMLQKSQRAENAQVQTDASSSCLGKRLGPTSNGSVLASQCANQTPTKFPRIGDYNNTSGYYNTAQQNAGKICPDISVAANLGAVVEPKKTQDAYQIFSDLENARQPQKRQTDNFDWETKNRQSELFQAEILNQLQALQQTSPFDGVLAPRRFQTTPVSSNITPTNTFEGLNYGTDSLSNKLSIIKDKSPNLDLAFNEVEPEVYEEIKPQVAQTEHQKSFLEIAGGLINLLQTENNLDKPHISTESQPSETTDIPFVCPHTRRRKIAKNMCYSCYHTKGKSKLATDCEHHDRPHYSKGMCQTCYLKDFYVKKKEKQIRKAKEEK